MEDQSSDTLQYPLSEICTRYNHLKYNYFYDITRRLFLLPKMDNNCWNYIILSMEISYCIVIPIIPPIHEHSQQLLFQS